MRDFSTKATMARAASMLALHFSEEELAELSDPVQRESESGKATETEVRNDSGKKE